MTRRTEHPYLTPNIPGTGGVLKSAPEDFRVEEIPSYLPSGEGEHLFLWIEKRGITTLEAVRRICKALDVPEKDAGYAGLKDAVGVTSQYMSIPAVRGSGAMGLELPGVRVLSAVRHGNKLKTGHLRGNRFRVVLRDVEPGAEESARAVLAVLAARGLPNYFGEQRYGGLGNSHLVGAALLRGDEAGAVHALMGDPEAVRDEGWRNAVLRYRAGDAVGALELFPPHCRTEREVLRRLVARPDDFRYALKGVHPRLVSLYVSAAQSFLFDAVLARRLDSFDRLLPGDVAFKHANGACFSVEDADAENARAAAGEVSPTGPLFGRKTMQPSGLPLAIEESVLAHSGLLPACFASGPLAPTGERRPLRVPLGDPSVHAENAGLVFTFSLPRGSYATSLIREVSKPSLNSN